MHVHKPCWKGICDDGTCIYVTSLITSLPIYLCTVDVKRTFPKLSTILPFNGIRMVKQQNGNCSLFVCFNAQMFVWGVPLPLSLIGLRYKMEVAGLGKAYGINSMQNMPSLSAPTFAAATSFCTHCELQS